MSLPISVRPAGEDDAPFVLNSWLRSMLDHLRSPWEDAGIAIDPQFSSVINAGYYERYTPRVRRALATGRTLVACNPEDHGHIYGWACTDAAGRVLHYAFTKSALRRFGVARLLWKESGAPRLLSHPGRLLGELQHRYGLRYDPEVL